MSKNYYETLSGIINSGGQPLIKEKMEVDTVVSLVSQSLNALSELCDRPGNEPAHYQRTINGVGMSNILNALANQLRDAEERGFNRPPKKKGEK